MAATPNTKLPKGAAQLVLWFKGLPQPTVFLTSDKEAESALISYAGGEDIEFKSFSDGSGTQSKSVFVWGDLRGVTIEYPTIQLAGM